MRFPNGLAPRIDRWAGRIFWFWYAIGLLLMLFYHVPAPLSFSNGLFLVFFAGYAVVIGWQAVRKRDRRLYLGAVLLTGGLGFAAEVFGTRTGLLFGAYEYTPTLGWSLASVPLALAAAWIGVVQAAVLVSPAASAPPGASSAAAWRWRLARALAAGLIAAAFDLVLDPVSAARGFWVWEGTGPYYGIPWMNFAAWFGLAALFSLAFPPMEAKEAGRARRRAGRLLTGMLVMFGLLGLKEGLTGVFTLALALALVVERRSRHDPR